MQRGIFISESVDATGWILVKSYVEMSNNLAIHLEALDVCPIEKYAKD
jgi:hypothetical protein